MSKAAIVMILSDATFRYTDGKATFGFMKCINGSIINAVAAQGPKLDSSKEEEAWVVLSAVGSKED